ncbi:carboxylate-amine ligase [Mycobacterium hubeiense]|uniref:carboxylate-amine ligase n=1 Tax=Mycobacterium hubeiense TaxID=1867256 RepID=UPI0018EC14F0|nr:YbdK family carboxylate-amine ligase [Mycobacterium sp. QGD 101]
MTTTIGVEEEFFLIDPVSRAVKSLGPQVVAHAVASMGELVTGEFNLCQLEVKTPPCADAAQLCDELCQLRAAAAKAAMAQGVRLCASGTPVVACDGPVLVGDHPRYRAGVAQYRAMLDDFAICSLHTHVYLPDAEVAVLVGNHLRPWLPLLVAMSANSPFYQSKDTGYASWRAVTRSRFPCLGPPPFAASLREHREIACAIAEAEAMLDVDTPFWDVRPNPRLPTIEIRAMDVTTDVDDTVALAVLLRAMVATATQRVIAGDPGPQPCSEVLRATYWQAARDGWSPRAAEQARRLIDCVMPALQQHGDVDLVTAFLRRLEHHGTGAHRQRASAARHGELTGVVDDLIAATAGHT